MSREYAVSEGSISSRLLPHGSLPGARAGTGLTRCRAGRADAPPHGRRWGGGIVAVEARGGAELALGAP